MGRVVNLDPKANPIDVWIDALRQLVKLKDGKPDKQSFVVVQDHKGKSWVLAVAPYPEGD
jgi:hypothetical protein